MSSKSPLCRLCENSTADGAIRAMHVDKMKLKTWFRNLYNYKLAKRIRDKNYICFGCIWHAESLAQNDPKLNVSAWWPASLDYLDDAAKERRKKYLEGEAERFRSQINSNEPAEHGNEELAEPQALRGDLKSCVFCGKQVKLLRDHMRAMHKEAIRCDFKKCANFFRTAEEKEKHVELMHGKPNEPRKFECSFCKRSFTDRSNYRRHVSRGHPESGLKCTVVGCLQFFERQEDMKSHLRSVHQVEEAGVVFECRFCDYKTLYHSHLMHHISRHHLSRTIKCDACGKMFATERTLATHVKQFHTYWQCRVCGSNVRVQSKTQHTKTASCLECKSQFECAGLYQEHLKACKETRFECSQCPRKYKNQYKLEFHTKMKHEVWRGLHYKHLGFECEPCKRFYPSSRHLKQHVRLVHTKQGFKQCAHCPKSFPDFNYLKNHLAEKHHLIERRCKCDVCGKGFVSSHFLAKHKVQCIARDRNRFRHTD